MKKNLLIVYTLSTLFFSQSIVFHEIAADEQFVLTYLGKGSELPVTTTFSIDENGYTVYEMIHTQTPKKNISFEYQLTAQELKDIALQLFQKFQIHKIPSDLKLEDMYADSSTQTISMAYQGQLHKIGGYAVHKIPEYKEVFAYIHALIQELQKKALARTKTGDNFSLRYEVQGSEYPVKITLSITAAGRCSYFIHKPNYGNELSSITTYEYQLPKKEFNAFVSHLINKLKYFQLPGTIVDEVMKMDGATSKITVSYQGKLHRIGGYNADHHTEYQGVFNLIRTLIKSIEKNGKKGGLK
jgi:hypothetical protein